MLTSCCSNPDHVSNMKEAGSRKDQEMAVSECRKYIKDFCFRHGIRNIRVTSPWTMVKEIGDGVWSDPVHLTEEGYIATAELLLKVASELASKPEADAGLGNNGHPFFSKEHSVLCLLFHSFKKNVPFFAFFSVFLKITECSLRSFLFI